MEMPLKTSSGKSLEEKLEIILREGKKSLVDHFQIYHSDDGYLKSPKFHYSISKLLLDSKKNFAIEAFRESAKTSLVVLDYPTYLLQFPRHEINYIVIIKQNQKLAEDKLRQIVLAYTTNPILSCNLKMIIRQSANIFEAQVKVGDGTTMNILFEAYGKGAALRGLVYGVRRPNLVLMDDLQDFEDSRSETVLQRDWEWFLSDVKQLGRNTRFFMIGNNLGEKCLIERVINLADELEFETLKIPAIKDGVAVWPEKFSLEFLEKERKSYAAAHTLHIWYRERMCESMASEYSTFDKGWFKYFNDEECPSNLRVFTTVDPAISQKSIADFSCVMTVGIDPADNKYILKYTNKRMNPSDLIDEIFRHMEEFAPCVIGIEKVAYQASILHYMEKEMVKRRLYSKLEPIETGGRKKSIRIEGLVPHYSNKKIYHRSGHSAELESQLLRFNPMFDLEHDDVIDALSMQINLWEAPVRAKLLVPRKTGKTLKELYREEGL